MELRDIEYFAVVAEHRHLGRAAEALDLSTSALSKSLRRLENSLQAKLVKRTPKGVELTAEGAALHVHVRQLQVSLADVAREVTELSQGRVGQLRIGAVAGLADSLLTTASISLLRDASKVILTVTLGNSDVLVPALRNGELDAIVSAISDVPYDDLIQEPLLDDDFIVCASANHRLARRKRLVLADLAQERWAITASNNQVWQKFHRLFEDNGLPPPKIAMVAISVSLRLRTIAATDLLGFISRRLLHEIRADIPLVELPLSETLYHRRLAIGYRKNGYLSPSARRFIEILKAAAKEIATKMSQPV